MRPLIHWLLGKDGVPLAYRLSDYDGIMARVREELEADTRLTFPAFLGRMNDWSSAAAAYPNEFPTPVGVGPYVFRAVASAIGVSWAVAGLPLFSLADYDGRVGLAPLTVPPHKSEAAVRAILRGRVVEIR